MRRIVPLVTASMLLACTVLAAIGTGPPTGSQPSRGIGSTAGSAPSALAKCPPRSTIHPIPDQPGIASTFRPGGFYVVSVVPSGSKAEPYLDLCRLSDSIPHFVFGRDRIAGLYVVPYAPPVGGPAVSVRLPGGYYVAVMPGQLDGQYYVGVWRERGPPQFTLPLG